MKGLLLLYSKEIESLQPVAEKVLGDLKMLDINGLQPRDMIDGLLRESLSKHITTEVYQETVKKNLAAFDFIEDFILENFILVCGAKEIADISAESEIVNQINNYILNFHCEMLKDIPTPFLIHDIEIKPVFWLKDVVKFANEHGLPLLNIESARCAIVSYITENVEVSELLDWASRYEKESIGNIKRDESGKYDLSDIKDKIANTIYIRTLKDVKQWFDCGEKQFDSEYYHSLQMGAL